MIRILQVFTIMNRGGAEAMIMNYYRHIDRSKVQFDFLVHRDERGAFDDEIESLGGKIFKVIPINPFFSKSYYNELRLFFKEHNAYSIIHSHLNTFSCFPLKIAKEFKIPVRIAHAHTASQDFEFKEFLKKEKIIKKIKILIKTQLKRNIHKYTTHCFACGEKAGKWLFGEFNDFKIINNAIDSSSFIYNKPKDLEYRKRMNLTNKIVLGHIGNFSEPKNHDFILEVFNQFIKHNNKSELILIGDGELKLSIEKKSKKLKIHNKIQFLGSRSDIANLCQIIDVFIFPSFYEGFPVTLVEAQAADIKIFASDSISKEVKITDNLIFIPLSSSSEIWAETILKHIPHSKKNNNHLIKKMGYDIKANARRLQDFYLEHQKNIR